ncbi:MAG: amidohydrolase family protein [Lachnospiraceae bacterium]|nr:amidohydrolase family protein [Lachnospiraceae bacterium]
MIIDFHTHVFPETMAKRVVDNMAVATGIMPYLDGSVGALTDSMARAGVDISILLPVLTKPSQYNTVNNYELSIAHEYENGTRLIAFGGVHPDSPTLKEDIKGIRRMGMKGIKLHPDYQQIDIDDPRNIRVMDYASEEGLITVVHAGLDMAFARHVHCTPPMVVNVLKEISPERLVLAHMGGLYYFDEVEELLVDRDVYFDTAYFIGKTNPRQITRIMREHGMDKILFATDSPWGDQTQNVNLMDTFELTPEELEKVFYKNAVKLLDMPELIR